MIAAIAIGRNEGARLEACLTSLAGQADPIVYVDSGSTDSSVEMARGRGVEVVELDMSVPFTAARARNAGIARVKEIAPETVFIQFLDGDCTLDAAFIGKARAALEAEPDLAVVCGRRRERFPEASLWNRMIDAEWDTPVGEARACGGDALIRVAALDAVGGYPDASTEMWDTRLTGPTAILVGAEDVGISMAWRNAVVQVRIPMFGRSDSLNASVAAALLLYEVRRQRR